MGDFSLDWQAGDGGVLQLVVKGKLDVENVGPLWGGIASRIAESRPAAVEVNARDMDECDAAGAALLEELKARQQADGHAFRIVGLRGEIGELLALFALGPAAPPVRKPSAIRRAFEAVGGATIRLLRDLAAQLSFIGEVCIKLSRMVIHPGRWRWGDTALIVEKAGADGVGITALMGFLIGLILAFQSGVAMKKFGAQLYVGDLVTIALFRELGPLIAAFILASRSGSAFAAELGTMKINEEIDALKTMGIDPVRFLVFPRLIGAVTVLPLLTLFCNLFGLIGCALVMVSIGFAFPVAVEQIQAAARLGDLVGGLVKTLVFGALIAGIGCLRGLQTGTGASAVGDSATRAVVSSIVAIVVTDGIFAVVYYNLGV